MFILKLLNYLFCTGIVAPILSLFYGNLCHLLSTKLSTSLSILLFISLFHLLHLLFLLQFPLFYPLLFPLIIFNYVM